MPLIITGVTPTNEAVFMRVTKYAGYWYFTKTVGDKRIVEVEKNSHGLFSDYVFTLENRGFEVEIIEPDNQFTLQLDGEDYNHVPVF